MNEAINSSYDFEICMILGCLLGPLLNEAINSPYDFEICMISGCLLGRMVEFERRIPRTNCYNGKDYEREINLRNCTCTRNDFEW